MVRCRRDTTFRKADVMRAIRAAQAVGISNPRIEIDRHGTITIVLGEPSKDNGAAAPDIPEERHRTAMRRLRPASPPLRAPQAD